MSQRRSGADLAAERRRFSVVPYSSVVGQAVSVANQSDAVVATMGIRVLSPAFDYRGTAEPLAEFICRACNHFDGYGLALMMISEGCANPQEVARAALARARGDGE